MPNIYNFAVAKGRCLRKTYRINLIAVSYLNGRLNSLNAVIISTGESKKKLNESCMVAV